ncbi:hypothetical protein BV283P3_00013 [Phocaeicola phage BV283P3]|nr:hypothetical protein BV185P1_00004 [Phocaeicola phage BV185P1]WAX10621.1 hypothetical protein BV283P3_00013 [Phocaeicola phage BV283P3]
MVTNIRVNCGVPQHGIEEFLLVDVEDINVIVVTNYVVTELPTFANPKPILVEAYKMTSQVTESLQGLDGSAAMKQTVIFNIFDKTKYAELISGLANRRFVVLAKHKDVGLYKVYGAYCGLELASADIDSNDAGGYAKISLSTPEGAQGEMSLTTTSVIYGAIKAQIPSN